MTVAQLKEAEKQWAADNRTNMGNPYTAQIKAAEKASTDKKAADAAAAEKAAAEAAAAAEKQKEANRRATLEKDTTIQELGNVAPIQEIAAAPTIQEAGPADTSMAAGAADRMAQYDKYAAAGMGASPEETMRLADAAARQTAQAESDAAIRSALKGAKTGGAMSGAAALAAAGQGANAYGTGMQRGTTQYFDTTKLGATLGSEMAGRLTTAAQLKQNTDLANLQARTAAANLQSETDRANLAARTTGAQLQTSQDQANLAARTAAMGARTGAESQALSGAQSAASSKYAADTSAAASKYAADQAAKAAKAQRSTGLISSAIGAAGGVLGAFSDKNLKENIKPESMTEGLEKVGEYGYNYKGSDRPEAGVMAQDLEKTNMRPAVIDTPKGKFVNTEKLSLMNTGAVAEQERRIQKIERLLKGLEEIGSKRGSK